MQALCRSRNSTMEWRLAQGAKRAKLEKWLLDELLGRFAGRIFLLDGLAAADWGVIMARGERMGQPISAMDAWSTATASIHELTIVTRRSWISPRMRVPC